MTAVSLKIGAAAAAVAGIVAALVTPHLGDRQDGVEAQIQAQLPDVRDYAWVALPAQPPPGGAEIETTHYANALRSGQVVLFEYRSFTVYACSVVPGYTDTGACGYHDNAQLRMVHLDGVVTRYSIGTKSQVDVRKVAPSLFRALERYISQSRFGTTPGWVTPYAEAQLRRMY